MLPTSAEKFNEPTLINPPNPELLQYQLTQPPPGVVQVGLYPAGVSVPVVSYQSGVMYPGASTGLVPGSVHQGVPSAFFPTYVPMIPAGSGPGDVQGQQRHPQQPALGLPTPVPSQSNSSFYQGKGSVILRRA